MNHTTVIYDDDDQFTATVLKSTLLKACFIFHLMWS